MELIETIEELFTNIDELGKDLENNVRDAFDLVKRGRSFVVSSNKGGLQFSPSRFIGYKDNNLVIHSTRLAAKNTDKKNDGPDGRDTDREINSVLKMAKRENALAESAFIQSCIDLGITPHDHKRKFWILPEAEQLIEERIVSEIENSDIPETEKLNISKSRLGQGKFRSELFRKWKKCCMTGASLESVLRASHIKPWSQCNNKERLDPNNGLLLVANADCLFDSGLISFNSNGAVIKSKFLSDDEMELLLGGNKFSLTLNEEQRKYMDYHREFVFQKK
ncbi:HNH endonuclease [Vibrio brasiliensis]|uniref:HNH endonuclease n=1 Tax=Vibrio brasiliensis TaxID=170652 RepID=UPI001EFDB7D3|nr:HNH endonuclease [Vibrio brasiliensis]MCG9782640.1 HNH endonuclease [Vibrio brasiliensis]